MCFLFHLPITLHHSLTFADNIPRFVRSQGPVQILSAKREGDTTLDSARPFHNTNEELNTARADPYSLPPFSRAAVSAETARDQEVRELRASNAALAGRLAQVTEMMTTRPEANSDITGGQVESYRDESEPISISSGRDPEVQALREANKALTKRLERVENQLDEPPPPYLVNNN